jgi:RHS repeat-associated protein
VTAYGPPPAAALGYDVANRLATVNTTNVYAYDPANQRVYFNTAGTETLYFYGLGGKKLATYTIAPSGSQVSFTFLSRNIYFAGKLISAEGKAVSVDRLGSVRWNATAGNHTYYPYGAEYSATSNDTEKYASYTRDSLTGLDYAMNRYYSSAWGRFMTPDPSYASMDLRIPQSWNRYMYALGDPIAESDPSGLDEADYGDDGGGDLGCPDAEMCFFGGGEGGGDSNGGGGTFTQTGPESTQTSGFGNLIDSNGNPIPLPVYGDPTIANANSTVTVTASQTSQIVSVSVTSSWPGVLLGSAIGGLWGPAGSAIGAVLGSMCGVGGNVSVASTPAKTSVYAGPTASCGFAVVGGSGFQVSVTPVPPSQDPNKIASGESTSITWQPTPITGSTVTRSPGSGPPVVGYSFGTRVPVSVGIGYNWCIWDCQP